jgi:hypothetical protein
MIAFHPQAETTKRPCRGSSIPDHLASPAVSLPAYVDFIAQAEPREAVLVGHAYDGTAIL